MQPWLRGGLSIALILVAFASFAAADPIVGSWTLDPKYGSYGEELMVRANGTLVYRIMGTAVDGTWRRVRPGVYTMTPSRSGDFLRLNGSRLEMWDREGFIRSFNRQ